MIGYHITEDPF